MTLLLTCDGCGAGDGGDGLGGAADPGAAGGGQAGWTQRFFLSPCSDWRGARHRRCPRSACHHAGARPPRTDTWCRGCSRCQAGLQALNLQLPCGLGGIGWWLLGCLGNGPTAAAAAAVAGPSPKCHSNLDMHSTNAVVCMRIGGHGRYLQQAIASTPTAVFGVEQRLEMGCSVSGCEFTRASQSLFVLLVGSFHRTLMRQEGYVHYATACKVECLLPGRPCQSFRWQHQPVGLLVAPWEGGREGRAHVPKGHW